MSKRWEVKPEPDKSLVKHLSEAININESLAALLVQRGITTFDEAKAYFRPQLSDLHDPFLMKDMDKAVKRIDEAIINREKILVYGDYDVDGTTAVATVYGFLRKFYAHTDFYIPDRYAEGYGISNTGIDWASDNGFTLIISLDCGIKSEQHIEYALEKGIDFIICDHHRPGDTLPNACAVLDPKREDCPYPYKELSGCGVGFKLLQAFCRHNDIEEEKIYPYLDLLAVSIASDIVHISGENRVLAFYGLRQLNSTPRPGLRALIEVAGFSLDDKTGGYNLNITNILFGIGPRINAAGRIAHARAAVQLLIEEDRESALQFADNINVRNDERREFDSDITRQALELIENDTTLVTAKSTVLFKDDWHKGVIGIVASRCIEKYYRPTIILTHSNGKATGSARSVPGFDVYEAISECADLIEQFGGHMYAAGLTLDVDNIPAFRERFEKVVSQRILPEQLIPLQEIDRVLKLSDINYKFLNLIKQFAPFGPENMTPVFMSEGVEDAGGSRVLEGRSGKPEHLKLSIRQPGSPVMDAIGFGFAEYYPQVATGKPFNICYTVEENNFRNVRSIQLLIKDIKFQD
jgi:single-stranded-DNA-specific exonuclease